MLLGINKYGSNLLYIIANFCNTFEIQILLLAIFGHWEGVSWGLVGQWDYTNILLCRCCCKAGVYFHLVFSSM